MPRATAAQGESEKEDVVVKKSFLWVVALVALLFPSGAGAVERVWSADVSSGVWSNDANWVPAGLPASVDHVVIGKSGVTVVVNSPDVAGGLLLSPDVSLDIQAGGSLTLGSGNTAVNIDLEGNAEIKTAGSASLDFVATVPQLNLRVPSSGSLKLGNMSAPLVVRQHRGSVRLEGTVTAAAAGTRWYVEDGLLLVKKDNAFSGNMIVSVDVGKRVQFEKGADAKASFDFAAGSSIADLDMADAKTTPPALKLNALSGNVTLNLIHVPMSLASGDVLRVIDCVSPIPAVAIIKLDSVNSALYDVRLSGDRLRVMIEKRAVASADAVVFTPSTDSLASREYEPGKPFAASFDVKSIRGQALTVVRRDLPGNPFPAWLGFAVTPKGKSSGDVTVALSGTPGAGVSGDIKLGFRASTAMASADMVYTIVKKKTGGSVPNPNPTPNPWQPGPLPIPNPGDPLLPDPNRKAGGSRGGCDTGLAGIVSLLALLPFLSRRRK